jgi:hypothetical protein
MSIEVASDLEHLMGPLDPASSQRISDSSLRAQAPPVGEILRRAHAAASAEIPTTAARGSWNRKRLARWGVPGVLVALAGGAIAATTVLGSAPASTRDMVRCYSVGHLTGDTHQYTDTAMATATGQAAAPDASATVGAAVDSCSALWRIGLIQPGKVAPDVASNPGDAAVPNLVACVLNSGEAAVLPGDDSACRNLGLAKLADRK